MNIHAKGNKFFAHTVSKANNEQNKKENKTQKDGKPETKIKIDEKNKQKKETLIVIYVSSNTQQSQMKKTTNHTKQKHPECSLLRTNKWEHTMRNTQYFIMYCTKTANSTQQMFKAFTYKYGRKEGEKKIGEETISRCYWLCAWRDVLLFAEKKEKQKNQQIKQKETI
mmetsp:Transcript_35195/g.56475  ORF Transcript_35195/g.56475 Transcript_35195/m.56475 type:complete len:168 (+) Transcript_35195:121-624(+)